MNQEQPVTNEAKAVAWMLLGPVCDEGTQPIAFTHNPDDLKTFPAERWEITPLIPAAEVERLEAMIRQLEANDRRYRYLRDAAHPDSDEGFGVMRESMSDWGKWYWSHITGAELDAEIDKATGATP